MVCYTKYMRLLINILLSGLAVFIASYILPGVHVDNFVTAIIVAIVLGVANAIIKPILLILTLPINILTLGLFTLILNGLIVLLVSNIVPGFKVHGIGWAILFSIVLWLINWFLSSMK